MKVCVDHQFVTGRSGGDLVNAIVVDELIKNNAKIFITSTIKSDVKAIFNNQYNMTFDFAHNPQLVTAFPKLKKSVPFLGLFNWIAIRKLLKKEKIDIIFKNDPFLKPIRNSLSGTRVILYSHFISDPLLSLKYASGIIPKVYFTLYDVIASYCLNDLSSIDTVVCNSTWTAKIFEEHFGIKPKIIHPPVKVKEFHTATKSNSVVMVGYFDPEKKFETAILALSKTQSKPNLLLVGRSEKISEYYIGQLKKLAKKLGVGDKVHFKVDVNFNELKDIMSHAKICLSCRSEHFGVAIVEEMASGCVPVVYEDGGVWTDILDHGKYGFGFTTTDQLSQTIDKILADETLFKKASKTAIDRAISFDESIFRKKIRQLIFQ
jgi:glycosyltransferase involved in cell wall biosynthesis